MNVCGFTAGLLTVVASSNKTHSSRSATSSNFVGTTRALSRTNSKVSFSHSSDFETLEKQLDYLRNDRQKLLHESRHAMEQQCDTNRDLRRVMKAYKGEAEACRKVS